MMARRKRIDSLAVQNATLIMRKKFIHSNQDSRNICLLGFSHKAQIPFKR
jgi:hypothetical protein